MMPDIVIEVARKTDEWPLARRKIDKYVIDGAGYAVANDPKTGEIYERRLCPAALVLDTRAIIEG